MTQSSRQVIPKVDIGVACRDMQGPEWWVPLLGECIALTKRSKVALNNIITPSSAAVDYNQNQIAHVFLKGDSEYLYMIEDDTVHPKETLLRLLDLAVPFASGVYFATNPPHNPIAYFRNTPEDEARNELHVQGTYRPVRDYERGEVFEVDSVGMGCSLIHRIVFEQIQKAYTLKMRRKNATLVLCKNGEVDPEADLIPPPEKDTRQWPFYAFEYGRTQDHWFCELAASVGFKPTLDTSIECDHYKRKPTSAMHHRVMSDQFLEYEAIRKGGE